jgi:hypothetical protein
MRNREHRIPYVLGPNGRYIRNAEIPRFGSLAMRAIAQEINQSRMMHQADVDKHNKEVRRAEFEKRLARMSQCVLRAAFPILMLLSFVLAVPVIAEPLKVEGLTKVDHAPKKHWYSLKKKQYHYKLKDKPGAPVELVTTTKIAKAPDLRPDKEQHPWKSKEAWAGRRDRVAAFGNKYSGAFGVAGSIGSILTSARIFALR